MTALCITVISLRMVHLFLLLFCLGLTNCSLGSCIPSSVYVDGMVRVLVQYVEMVLPGGERVPCRLNTHMRGQGRLSGNWLVVQDALGLNRPDQVRSAAAVDAAAAAAAAPTPGPVPRLLGH